MPYSDLEYQPVFDHTKISQRQLATKKEYDSSSGSWVKEGNGFQSRFWQLFDVLSDKNLRHFLLLYLI